MAVEFRLLGEIEAWVDGAAIPLGHLRQRCVLAILLAEANRVVSVAELVDRVWGERPPHSARESVYSYLSRLRYLVAGIPDVQLVRRSGGYLVAVDPLVIDMHLFRHLTGRAGESGDDAAAAAVLDGRWPCGGARRSRAWTHRGSTHCGRSWTGNGSQHSSTATTSPSAQAGITTCSPSYAPR